jgi:hypothetical protein
MNGSAFFRERMRLACWRWRPRHRRLLDAVAVNLLREYSQDCRDEKAKVPL